MAKNKLQKFADMATYAHVFQYPFAVLKERGFDMRGNGTSIFFITTILLYSSWVVAKASMP